MARSRTCGSWGSGVRASSGGHRACGPAPPTCRHMALSEPASSGSPRRASLRRRCGRLRSPDDPSVRGAPVVGCRLVHLRFQVVQVALAIGASDTHDGPGLQRGVPSVRIGVSQVEGISRTTGQQANSSEPSRGCRMFGWSGPPGRRCRGHGRTIATPARGPRRGLPSGPNLCPAHTPADGRPSAAARAHRPSTGQDRHLRFASRRSACDVLIQPGSPTHGAPWAAASLCRWTGRRPWPRCGVRSTRRHA